MLACTGAVEERGDIDVRGSYAAPPGPDWGWRIVIRPADREGRGVMVRFPSLLPLAALALGGAAPGAAGQSDFWFTNELAPYRELVEQYRDADARAAMAGVRAMAPSAVRSLLDRVREPDTRLPGTDAEPALNERPEVHGMGARARRADTRGQW